VACRNEAIVIWRVQFIPAPNLFGAGSISIKCFEYKVFSCHVRETSIYASIFLYYLIMGCASARLTPFPVPQNIGIMQCMPKVDFM